MPWKLRISVFCPEGACQARIVRDHVNVYYDNALDNRAREQYWKLKDALDQAYAEALEPFEEELDELEQTLHSAQTNS